MYKTIRHGENSLQYTILPQNDDFRIEGKLSSAGSNCTSGTSRKPKVKRPRRRSFFAYLGLIFVCTVIVGAILIPFLVSAECLPNPTEWFLKTKAALTKGNVEANRNQHVSDAAKVVAVGGNGINVGKLIKIINKDGSAKVLILNNNQTTIINTNATTTTTNIDTNNTQAYRMPNTSNIISKALKTEVAETATAKLTAGSAATLIAETAELPQLGSEQINALDNNVINNNDSHAATTQSANFVTEVRFESASSSSLPQQLVAIVPTIVVTTVRAPDIPTSAKVNTAIRPTSSLSAANVNSPRLPATSSLGSQAAAPAIPTIMTRIIQVPLLKSAAKKPIIPPVLAKTNSHFTSPQLNDAAVATATNGDTSTNLSAASIDTSENAKTSSNSKWIHTHWPYIDPSTYFQWTGYKAEDSVLLPALLGFALIGMILIITVCLVARNKRTIVTSVRKRNRNDIEGTGAEDNATLLTTTNLSDED